MAEKDFKVKNGLFVTDSANINNLRVRSGATVVGAITATGGVVGNVTGQVSTLSNHNTGGLSEGSNLYYTTGRVNTDATALVDSAYITLRTPEYVRLTSTQTLTNKTLVDPIIDSSKMFGLQYGGISFNDDGLLGDSTQSVLNFASSDSSRSAVLSLGVSGQFNHGIGVLGTSSDNDMVIGFEGANTELKIKSGVGKAPFNLTGGTDRLTMSTDGRFTIHSGTEAASKTNAAFMISGGLGVDKNIRGQDIIAAGNITATGSLFGTLSAASLSARSTTDLSEGSNLYYTSARVDSYINASILTSDVSEGSNLYYTTARADSDAKRAVSVTDGGGDGGLAYNSATGVITYTGPNAGEVRAHFSNGTGVTITNGSVAIGQDVSTSANPTFATMTTSGNVTVGNNLTVGGSYILNTTTDLRVTNALIKLADSNNGDAVDIGVVGRYRDSAAGPKRRAGFFRDATNGEWTTFTNLIQDGLDSSVPDSVINTSGDGFQLGTWNFGKLRGSYLGFDSDFRVFSTNYTIYESDFTAVSAGRYAIDTSSRVVNVTLPQNPVTGDYVRLIDVANYSTNSVIVNRNGETIEGFADNFELDLGQSIIELIHINNNWQLYSSIGQRGQKGDKGDSADVATFSTQSQAIAFAVALG